jgi:formyltetrahydrofolate-dependent phosphoribosylglycinamide formyltransferase
MRVAVLASGGGSNLQALLDACTADTPAQITLVVSDKPTARALERARAVGVSAHVLDDVRDGDALNALLTAHDVGLVVLAGYLKLVPESTVAAYGDRMINIHPALLPAFGGPGMYGRHVHEAVLASGATLSGCTVHRVTAAYDEGSILAQWPVPVRADDTPTSLAARVLAVEHQLLPAVVLAAARANRVVRLPSTDDYFTTAGSAPSVGDALASNPID